MKKQKLQIYGGGYIGRQLPTPQKEKVEEEVEVLMPVFCLNQKKEEIPVDSNGIEILMPLIIK